MGWILALRSSNSLTCECKSSRILLSSMVSLSSLEVTIVLVMFSNSPLDPSMASDKVAACLLKWINNKTNSSWLYSANLGPRGPKYWTCWVISGKFRYIIIHICLCNEAGPLTNDFFQLEAYNKPIVVTNVLKRIRYLALIFLFCLYKNTLVNDPKLSTPSFVH